MAENQVKRRGRKKRILVVDDDQMICQSLNLLLSQEAIEIKAVHNGEEALAELDKKLPHLVILDFSLPDINGLEVLTAIREKSKKLPVIFMTGFGSETVSIKAFKMGVTDYVIKPFHPNNFKLSIFDAIGRKHTEVYDEGELIPPYSGQEIEDSSGVWKAVQYIKDNYRLRTSLEDVSNVAGISKHHFARAFKKVMGIPFSGYLSHFRIKKAEEILQQKSMNITEVAYKVGFNSLRQFERTFKKVSGKTPQNYRKECHPND